MGLRRKLAIDQIDEVRQLIRDGSMIDSIMRRNSWDIADAGYLVGIEDERRALRAFYFYRTYQLNKRESEIRQRQEGLPDAG